MICQYNIAFALVLTIACDDTASKHNIFIKPLNQERYLKTMPFQQNLKTFINSILVRKVKNNSNFVNNRLI